LTHFAGFTGFGRVSRIRLTKQIVAQYAALSMSLGLNGSGYTTWLMVWMALFLVLAIPGYSQGSVALQNEQFETRFTDGVNAFRAGALDKAEQDFIEALKLHPRFAEGYMNLALVQERMGRSTDEIGSLQSALRLKPTLKGANLFLGIAYYREDKFSEAKIALNREVALSPLNSKALMWLGIVDEATNDPQAAVEVLDKAAKIAPKDSDILYNRGRAALLLSQKSYEEMYHLDPNSWRVHQVLAQAFAESDRHVQAIAEYQLAIQQAPDEAELYENLGTEYWKGSQLDLAEAQFAKEVELNPDNPMALYYLGSLYVDRDKPGQGVPLLRKALTIDPAIADANYYLGRGEMALGNAADAVPRFQQAIQLANEAGASGTDLAQRSWYQLAIGYRHLQKNDEARAALAEFQKLKQQSDAATAQNFEELKKQHEKAEQDSSGKSAPPGDANSTP